MKRIALFTITLILLLCMSVSLADEADETAAVLKNAGIQQPVQMSQWGSTAACFAETDGMKRLIVMEKRDGIWQIVINNPTALMQNAEWPKLWLDSDNAVFWTYTLSETEMLRYHSTRGSDGVWGAVSQYYTDSGYGDLICSWSALWDEAHGGEIVRSFTKTDENDNMLGGVQMQFIPATWLGDCIRLAEFDQTRFPVLIADSIEDERFFRDAAVALMPDYTCLKGMLKNGALHFLMQKPDGTKVYIVCDYASHREVNLIESSALPDNTYLGVENFTDCLWIDGRSVAVQLFPAGDTAGIEYIYNDEAHRSETAFLYFGDSTVWADDNENLILYGDHPWDDITEIDWNSLPRTLEEASVQMDSDNYAMVVNPKPADRLHLRERPDKGSRSQCKYYTGTRVTIAGNEKGDWAQVITGGGHSFLSGWMMKRYLTRGQKGQALRLDLSAMPKLFMKNQYLYVYQEPMKSSWHSLLFEDSGMRIIGVIGSKWYHVWFPGTGEYGFVQQSDLTKGNG